MILKCFVFNRKMFLELIISLLVLIKFHFIGSKDKNVFQFLIIKYLKKLFNVIKAMQFKRAQLQNEKINSNSLGKFIKNFDS